MHFLVEIVVPLPGAKGQGADEDGEEAVALRQFAAEVQQHFAMLDSFHTFGDHKPAKGGGEGLMLHRANALWAPGRSDALRKLKLQPDEEEDQRHAQLGDRVTARVELTVPALRDRAAP